MVMVSRELKILDETGLPEKNWKNEIATKKKLAGSLKKKSFVRPRNEFEVKKQIFKIRPVQINIVYEICIYLKPCAKKVLLPFP